MTVTLTTSMPIVIFAILSAVDDKDDDYNDYCGSYDECDCYGYDDGGYGAYDDCDV